MSPIIALGQAGYEALHEGSVIVVKADYNEATEVQMLIEKWLGRKSARRVSIIGKLKMGKRAKVKIDNFRDIFVRLESR